MAYITTSYIGNFVPHACCRNMVDNPRWGLGYVITTIGPSWEMGTEKLNNLTQERQFLQALKGLVSLPKKDETPPLGKRLHVF